MGSVKLTVALSVLLITLIFSLVVLIVLANPTLIPSLTQVSKMTVSNKDGQTIFKLSVSKKDAPAANLFFSNLGLQKESFNELSFQFDTQTQKLLDNYLPTEAKIEFLSDGSGLRFRTPSFVLLSPQALGKEYNFSTGSATLRYKTNERDVYSLNLKDPATIVAYSTASGQLYLAKSLTPLMPYLSKVATIKVEVNGKEIQGEMTLK